MQMCHCCAIEDTHISLAGGGTHVACLYKQYSLNQGVVLPSAVERFRVTNLKVVWSSLDRILCHQSAFILL